MDVTAENLANADTTKAANGQPYQRQEVVLAAGRLERASAARSRARCQRRPSSRAATAGRRAGHGDRQPTPRPTSRSTTPATPKPNAQGYVKMPNISTVTEMTDLISESQSYQSDVTAMQTAKSMFTSTLGLLK